MKVMKYTRLLPKILSRKFTQTRSNRELPFLHVTNCLGLIYNPTKYHKMSQKYMSYMYGSRGDKGIEGGQGVPTPTPSEKSRKYRVCLQSFGDLDPLKITKLPIQHLMLGHHRPASEMPFKRRFAGGPMMPHL